MWRGAPVPLFMADCRLAFTFVRDGDKTLLLVIGDEGVEFELEEVAISMDYWYRRLSIGLAGLGWVGRCGVVPSLPSSGSEGMMSTYRRDVKLEEERVDQRACKFKVCDMRYAAACRRRRRARDLYEVDETPIVVLLVDRCGLRSLGRTRSYLVLNGDLAMFCVLCFVFVPQTIHTAVEIIVEVWPVGLSRLGLRTMNCRLISIYVPITFLFYPLQFYSYTPMIPTKTKSDS